MLGGPWLKGKRAAAHYAGGVSVRTLDAWLGQGLRYSRLPSGTLMFRAQWIDEFLSQYEVEPENHVRATELANRILSSL